MGRTKEVKVTVGELKGINKSEEEQDGSEVMMPLCCFTSY